MWVVVILSDKIPELKIVYWVGLMHKKLKVQMLCLICCNDVNITVIVSTTTNTLMVTFVE